MSVFNERMLRESLERYCRQFAEALLAEGSALQAGMQTRLIDEAVAGRRKLLAALSERVGATWREFCKEFHDSLSFRTQVRAGLLVDDDRESVSSSSSLRLVDDDQMEWDIALAGIGSRCAAVVGGVLGEAELRLAVLTKKTAEGEGSTPLSPEVLVGALKRAFDRTVQETDYRRSLLIWLDPSLARILAEQVNSLNEMLKDEGVEPAARTRATASPSRGGNSGSGSGGALAGDDVASVLQQILQNQAAGGGGVGGGGMAAVPAAMLESLNRLQSLDLSALQSNAVLDAPPGTNVLRELRQHDAVRSLPPIEAVTIDIVATLFDFIFDDALVPDSVKALVGRLQIPLLKVAMLDKSFFSNKEHPARAFLNEVSRISAAAGKNLGSEDPVFLRIKAAVNRVLDEFEKDQGVFTELLAEMHTAVAEQEVRAEELTEKTRQVAEEQERTELAEIKAGEAFARILEDGLPDYVPSHIGDFLARKYPLVLKRALQNGGVQGPAWALATQTLSDLLWSLTPKESPDERQRMVAMLPDLLRRMNAFFDKADVTPEEKSPFMNALVQQHFNAIKGVQRVKREEVPRAAKAEEEGASSLFAPAVGAGAVATSQDMASSLVVTHFVRDDGIEVESLSVAGRMAKSRPVRSREVSEIKRGDWVDFISSDGSVTRARLSWVSPQRGVMLFTNPKSSKAISVSLEAFAMQLRNGQGVILGDAPMVERALDRTLASSKAA